MEGNPTFPNLTAQGQLGTMTLRNRMALAPTLTNYGTADGYVSQRNMDYYSARAAGGIGLLIVGAACVEYPRGRRLLYQLSIDDDKFLPGLCELSSAIRQHGARAFVQLVHAGREAPLWGGAGPVAPSPIRSLNPTIQPPHTLTATGIRELVNRFVAAAERAKRAGFDGVELHGAHAYLIGQFISPLCNKRDDEYGGSLANRARFLVEIVQGIRDRLGREYTVTVRLSGAEFAPEGGFTIEDTCVVAKIVENAGADGINVSAGGATCPKSITVAPACYPNGHLLHLAEQVRSAVRVPVIGVGRLNTPALAEAALRDGKCDIVGFGRAVIVDPEFPNKVIEGRPEAVRPCVACMHCHNSVVAKDGPMICALNPAAGRERELAVVPAVARKSVFVVGGGVAGMEAARVAALRGHSVTLFERADRLGGQLIAAAIPPHKSELNLLRSYYIGQLEETGVTVRLGEVAEAPSLSASRPDSVIVATGSQPLQLEVPGSDRPNVMSAEDVLLGRATVGERVAVIGGELVGCETAEYLAVQGKLVTVLRRGPELATKIVPTVRQPLLERMANLNITVRTNVHYEQINERGVVITTPDSGRLVVEADTVVIAAGSSPARSLAEDIGSRLPVVRVIGDAAEPRRFLEAIQEGMAAGLAV